MITDEQKQAIKDYVQDKPVEVLYLFGSQALGTARSDSDYDFGVIFQTNKTSHQKFDLKLEILGFLTGLFKTDKVDLLDLESSPIRFQFEAIYPRNIIYERDIDKTKVFEYDVLTRYFDEMYFMKQMTQDYKQQFIYD